MFTYFLYYGAMQDEKKVMQNVIWIRENRVFRAVCVGVLVKLIRAYVHRSDMAKPSAVQCGDGVDGAANTI